MPSAVAYFTNARLIVAPVSPTPSGIMLAHSPRWFGKSVKKPILAAAIADAMAAATSPLPDLIPEQAKRNFIPFQDAAGVKNFKTFMRDAHCVDLDSDGARVTLTPLTNLGPSNGFEPNDGDAVTVPATDSDAVAGTLLHLLGLRPAPSA
ncbi:hypothetical protein ASG37_12155 [Sphingomonas sp. Leaf407]|uniref:hypothetical protein n=1 Tax=unclassified Sphingomonas TaxID=196159 RepID=UPI0006FF364D|nr:MULTISPECIES: hypothetical protein [unclassified Sphingomonas]KQN37758.1 hypothetical protein ASE97_09445 [Sphingomonas sp. Leaf42]KQT28125.1 hypothetical protein ASG37_12155 [Sphingomonas sp. Leaf407]